LQNSPLESSCVVVALIENYSTSKPLKVSSEKSQILFKFESTNQMHRGGSHRSFSGSSAVGRGRAG